jgi:type I restriction enzyme S subunit
VLVVEDETFTGRTKPFSYLIRGPAWVNNHAHVLRPLNAVTPEFLNASLAYYPFVPLTTGTTGRRKLTQKALLAAPVAVPPLLEQERIGDLVAAAGSIADASTATVDHQAMRIARLRQSILRWAFEGKLVDQNPNDEPASALLERIRAERAAAPSKKPSRPKQKAAR